MDIHLIWKTLLIFVVATILLKLAGRKSISQMTIPQTVIMIAFGTLIIDPVTGHGLWTTFALATVLVIALFLTEMMGLYADKAETVITGKAYPVIEKGKLHEKNLRKLRLTVDQLEAQLRQAGISSISHIEMATIESDGQIGYTLKDSEQPATKGDIERLIKLLQTGTLQQEIKTPMDKDIFHEIITRDSTPPPKRLQ